MMPVKHWVPMPHEISKEVIVVVLGAIGAALVFSNLPALKAFVASRLPTAALSPETSGGLPPSVN